MIAVCSARARLGAVFFCSRRAHFSRIIKERGLCLQVQKEFDNRNTLLLSHRAARQARAERSLLGVVGLSLDAPCCN